MVIGLHASTRDGGSFSTTGWWRTTAGNHPRRTVWSMPMWVLYGSDDQAIRLRREELLAGAVAERADCTEDGWTAAGRSARVTILVRRRALHRCGEPPRPGEPPDRAYREPGAALGRYRHCAGCDVPCCTQAGAREGCHHREVRHTPRRTRSRDESAISLPGLGSPSLRVRSSSWLPGQGTTWTGSPPC